MNHDLEAMELNTCSNLWCRYNDLRMRIFSKHPALFPEEVLNLNDELNACC